MIVTRQETPADKETVRRINELAFGQPNEADLVEALRAAGAVDLSLVAELDGEIVGHILFAPVHIENMRGATLATALAPLAVLPERQRRGAGSTLVRNGLDVLARMGHRIVFVLGHPEYYPRFGFTPAAGYGVRCEFDVPGEAFMALALREGALKEAQGTVRYHPAFSLV